LFFWEQEKNKKSKKYSENKNTQKIKQKNKEKAGNNKAAIKKMTKLI